MICVKKIRTKIAIANSRANTILRGFTTNNLDTLSRLFNTYVRPILQYNTYIWTPSKAKYVNLVENVQRRFTRITLNIRGTHCSYLDRLKFLQLETLELRRFHFDIIMTFKILSSFLVLKKDDFFTPARTSITRSSNNQKLFKPVSGNNFFANRVIDSWNSLPNSVVNSRSTATFSRRLRLIPPTSMGFISKLITG